jgi:hypothetical protein
MIGRPNKKAPNAPKQAHSIIESELKKADGANAARRTKGARLRPKGQPR